MCVREARIDNLEDATSKASPSVLPCQADGNFLPSLVGLMNMMTRVNKTSVGVSAMLLAVLLLVGGTSMPAFAKEDLSAGQAGDPTDGNGITSTSGATSEDQGQSSAAATIKQSGIRLAPTWAPHELVLMVNGAVYHIDLQRLLCRWGVK